MNVATLALLFAVAADDAKGAAPCADTALIEALRAETRARPGAIEPVDTLATLLFGEGCRTRALVDEVLAALDAVTDDRALALLRKAQLFQKIGRVDDALAAHRGSHALRVDPRNLHRLVPMLVSVGARDEAERICRDALAGASGILKDSMAFECFAGLGNDGWATPADRAAFRGRLRSDATVMSTVVSFSGGMRDSWLPDHPSRLGRAVRVVTIGCACARPVTFRIGASDDAGVPIRCAPGTRMSAGLAPGQLLWTDNTWAIVSTETMRVTIDCDRVAVER